MYYSFSFVFLNTLLIMLQHWLWKHLQFHQLGYLRRHSVHLDSTQRQTDYVYFGLSNTFDIIPPTLLLPRKHVLLGTFHSYISWSHSFLANSRDSTICIATDYGLGNRVVGVRVPVRERIFSSPRHPDRFWGPPRFLPNWVPGALSPRVKRPGREAHHSPSASAEVKNGGAVPPLAHASSWHNA
jgi:hypothetical protein